MDSDDEFDYEVDRIPSTRGGRVANGLNFRDLVEQGSTHFSIEETGRSHWDEGDDRELRLANMLPRKELHKNYTADELNDEHLKAFLGQDFSKLSLSQEGGKGEDLTYAEMAGFMENITEDGGIKKKVIQQGHGGKIQPGQVVYVDYIIAYEAGDETLKQEQVVDTTTLPDRSREPFRFKVGAGKVIPVFDLGVLSMQPHESAMFFATYKYAYGKLGLYQEVPPETTVKVQICIKRVVDGCENLNVWELDQEERQKLPFEEKMKAVNELKEYGKDHIAKAQYQQARLKYGQGLQILYEIITLQVEEATKLSELKYILLINTAYCRIKEKEFRRARHYLEDAINLELPTVHKVKAYYRMAICNCELGEFDTARKNIDMAKAIDGANSDIDELYVKLHQKILRDHEAEKSYAMRMFK